MRNYTKLFKQVFFFGLVGGGSFLIDVTVTTLLFDYTSMPAGIAGCFGFLSAFFFNFPLNRKHVFKRSELDKFSLKTQVVLYFCLSGFNLLMTGLLIQVLVSMFDFRIAIAKACVTALIAIWNFFIFKFIVFSKRPNTAEMDSLTVQ